jgi:predicted SAM-dependent methyltransferase
MENVNPVIKYTKNKKAYLNIGCGNIFAADWNNLDFIKHPNIIKWDIRKGLPYPDSSMDAVYSSHTLEHMTPKEAQDLLSEVARVLKIGGIVRIAVPDISRVCEEYLKCLKDVEKDPSTTNNLRYDWLMLELIDQMVREKSGGRMRETIDSGNFDREYAQSRIGDLAQSGKIKGNTDTKFIATLKRTKRFIMKIIKTTDPRKTGEVHRWMYDKYSLGRLLRSFGFKNITALEFNMSRIPDWNLYQFDRSKFDISKAKKPESLFMEGVK